MIYDMLWIPFWTIAGCIAYHLIKMVMLWAIAILRWARGED